MQKIDNIEIKNFKSIRHQKIEGCKRINVFVGPPNVGKSNILEAIGLFLLLDHSHSQPLTLQKLTRINKADQLFFNGFINEDITIALNGDLKLTIGVSSNLNLKITALEIPSTVPPMDVSQWNKEPKQVVLKSLDGISADTNIKGNYKFNITSINNSVNPIRKYIFRNLSVNVQFATLTKYLVPPFGENISDIIFSIPEVKNKLIELFDSHNLKISRSDSQGFFNVLKELNDGSFLILDFELIAETLQRLIFHQAAILSNKDAILLFEEPESHLYEPYILDITNSIKNDKNNNQFFIVTHNQYFVDELLRDEESRNDTNIYLVGTEKGETKIKLLSPEVSKDVYQTGLNIFFNYQSLWDEN